MNKRQISAWAGMIGATLFVLTFTLEGWYRPDYNSLEMTVSVLSLGSRGWIQISNFIFFSVLLLVFTWGIASEFPNGKASRGGFIILIIIAICYFLAGLFVKDPVNTPSDQMTFHGTVHAITGTIAFLLKPVSCFVFLRRFRIDPKWQYLRWWTLVLGIICAFPFILGPITMIMPEIQNIFQNRFGLVQRIAIVSFMFWIFIFALGLLRQSRINKGP